MGKREGEPPHNLYSAFVFHRITWFRGEYAYVMNTATYKLTSVINLCFIMLSSYECSSENIRYKSLMYLLTYLLTYLHTWYRRWVILVYLFSCFVATFCVNKDVYTVWVKKDAQLSQRDRAAGCVILFAKSRRLNWETIFYGHYRSIFNHCDIIGLKICRVLLKTQNKGYYGVQSHSRSSRSVPIESQYAISYYWLIVTEILSRTVSELSQLDQISLQRGHFGMKFQVQGVASPHQSFLHD